MNLTLKEGDKVEFGSEPGDEYIVRRLAQNCVVFSREIEGPILRTRVLMVSSCVLLSLADIAWTEEVHQEAIGACTDTLKMKLDPERSSAYFIAAMMGNPLPAVMVLSGMSAEPAPFRLTRLNGTEIPPGRFVFDIRDASEFN